MEPSVTAPLATVSSAGGVSDLFPAVLGFEWLDGSPEGGV